MECEAFRRGIQRRVQGAKEGIELSENISNRETLLTQVPTLVTCSNRGHFFFGTIIAFSLVRGFFTLPRGMNENSELL